MRSKKGKYDANMRFGMQNNSSYLISERVTQCFGNKIVEDKTPLL